MFFSLLFLLFLLGGEVSLVSSVVRLSSALMTAANAKSKVMNHHPFPEHTIQSDSLLSDMSYTTLLRPKEISEVDLWVVGCGKLGMLVAKQWLELFPTAVIVGETISTTNHAAIAELGAIPRLRSDRYIYL